MRSFIVICLIAVAAAAPQGYNYPKAEGYNFNAQGSLGEASQVGAQTVFRPEGYNYNAPGSLGEASQFGAQAVAAPEQPTQAPVVSKYFYIHSAPEDTENAADLAKSLGPARKTYKVVFVKAPHDNLAKAVQALAAARDEEQTAIYVLHKKTDAAELKAALAAAPHEPSKPSVHFIKYKTAEEAALAQKQIQAQYDALGGTSQVSNEGVAPLTSVVGRVPARPSSSYLPVVY